MTMYDCQASDIWARGWVAGVCVYGGASTGVRLWGCVGDCAQELQVCRATYGVMFDC